MSPNLVKYAYGSSLLEHHHKIEKRNHWMELRFNKLNGCFCGGFSSKWQHQKWEKKGYILS
jgi:hypothetical protein